MAKNEDPHAANVPPVLEANFSLQRNYIGLLFILPQIEYQACIGYNIRDFSPVYSKVKERHRKDNRAMAAWYVLGVLGFYG